MDTWHDMGHTSNLSLSLDKKGMRAKKSPFLGLDHEREGRRGKEESQCDTPIPSEGTQPEFPFLNSGDPPGTPTD